LRVVALEPLLVVQTAVVGVVLEDIAQAQERVVVVRQQNLN
jgi:hypothetical protein